MCGRYVLIDGKMVLASFALLRNVQISTQSFAGLPRYNASPMQKMPIIATRDRAAQVQQMQWWLVPHWSKEPKTAFSTFNAKAETLEQSKLYSPYFKGSRCLVPADAFYEWKTISGAAPLRGKKETISEKISYCIRMADKRPFLFAGLFSVWKDPKGNELPTFTIITTTPNELMSDIHTRMPVILDEKHIEQWLDREYNNTDQLRKLLVPYPSKKMKAFPVSKLVNNTRNDSPECMEQEEQGKG